MAERTSVGSVVALVLPLLLCEPRAAYPQHPNLRVSSPNSTDPNETTISINPANPLQVAAGANLSYHYYSLDGGISWTEGILSSTLGVAGDPVVLFDALGKLYYAHLSAPDVGDWLDRIVVQRSDNGGLSWDDGAGIGLNPPRDQDKPGLATDMTGSPFRGNVYLAWTEFDAYGSGNPADSTRILFSRSTDSGTTWSAPVRVSDAGGNCLDRDDTVEGAIPAVGPEGQVYLAWSGPDGIRFDRSFDGGVTFGQDVFVTSQPGGWDFDVSGLWRANGLPTTLCDISDSPYRGHVYVVWSDQRAGTGDTNVFLVRSTDGGQDWGQPVRVNDDLTATHQFFPAATIDPTTGVLCVLYYDRRATSGDATDVYLSRSYDGGATFESLLVSDSPFVPDAGAFFGDYIGVAAWERKIHSIWMRMDEGNLSVWAAQLTDTGAVVDVSAESLAKGLTLLGAAPNPVRSSTRLSYTLPAAGHVTVRIVDVQGREIATLVEGRQEAGAHGVQWNARGQPAGVYFCRISAGGATAAGRLIVVR